MTLFSVGWRAASGFSLFSHVRPASNLRINFAAIHAKSFDSESDIQYRYAHRFFILTVFSILTEIHIQK